MKLRRLLILGIAGCVMSPAIFANSVSLSSSIEGIGGCSVSATGFPIAIVTMPQNNNCNFAGGTITASDIGVSSSIDALGPFGDGVSAQASTEGHVARVSGVGGIGPGFVDITYTDTAFATGIDGEADIEFGSLQVGGAFPTFGYFNGVSWVSLCCTVQYSIGPIPIIFGDAFLVALSPVSLVYYAEQTLLTVDASETASFAFFDSNLSPIPDATAELVPEPGTFPLLALGAALLGFFRLGRHSPA